MSNPIFEWSDGYCYVKHRPGDIALVIPYAWAEDRGTQKMIEEAYIRGFRDGAGKGPSSHENTGPSTTEKSDATKERKLEENDLDQHQDGDGSGAAAEAGRCYRPEHSR